MRFAWKQIAKSMTWSRVIILVCTAILFGEFLEWLFVYHRNTRFMMTHGYSSKIIAGTV